MSGGSGYADIWGEPVAAESSVSVDAWNEAWAQFNMFTGDPFAVLADANRTDTAFAMGSVFCAAYLTLGGSPLDAPELLTNYERAREVAVTDRELGHLAALDHLVVGNFTKAAKQWDAVAAAGHDFAAVRFAHDVYLHVGDAAGRLASSEAAFDRWPRERAGWSYVASQLAFAFEEVRDFEPAERLGREALAEDPQDLWALHALAHLYETLDDSETALDLLYGQKSVWTRQDSLAVHIWWHLALRLIATGALDEALAIHDHQLEVATTPFRMCDLASLLWRLELAGVDVGDRWAVLADRFAPQSGWHTSGFLDLHAAFIYTRCPEHPASRRFFEGVVVSHSASDTENDLIFREVVQPLVAAVRHGDTNPADSADTLTKLAPGLHRIGGSIAQRDVVHLTGRYYSESSNAPEAT